ncbi:MAG: glycosyltransferase [Actinobacteria bacterium]|nr:glycosyltransferase [Actinomycetota bacterium]
MDLVRNKFEVSIVMSIFGYEKYVEESVESILRQTFTNIEFIIIDDNCSYDLYKKIRKFNDERIIYIRNKENIGLTESLIKGISAARGKYIARQDAGNISLVDRIEKQYNYLENNKDYYLIGSSVILIDECSREICKIIADTDAGSVRRRLPENNCIDHSTIMFRNTGENIYRAGFRYSQDYDFYLNLLSKGIIFGNMPDILLKERLIPDSITYAKRNEQLVFENLARRFYFERLKYSKDSYDLLDTGEFINNPQKSIGEKDNFLFFCRQKAYFLLYSEKPKAVREFIAGVSRKKLDVKLLLYFVLSYLPFLIKILSRIRKINLK